MSSQNIFKTLPPYFKGAVILEKRILITYYLSLCPHTVLFQCLLCPVTSALKTQELTAAYARQCLCFVCFGWPSYSVRIWKKPSSLTSNHVLGSRAKRLRLNNLGPINWIRLIIILLYIFAICFVFTAAILTSGLGLTSNRDCYTAVFACLVFYFGNKIIMYMFLVRPKMLSE